MVQRDNEDAEKPWIVEFWRPDGATNITKLSSKELLVTCRIMKVRRSVQLVGRRFIPSRNLTPSETLARRIFYFHNPKYKAPSPEAFWEMAKEALTKLQCPDFSAHDPEMVNKAFRLGYIKNFPNAEKGDYKTRSMWLEDFFRPMRDKGLDARLTNPLNYVGEPLVMQLMGKGKRVQAVISPFLDGQAFYCHENPPR
jgi:hypothetical protein